MDGVLYVAFGERFLAEAQVSAASAKREMPAIPITLVTDQDAAGPFDEVVRVAGEDGFRAKIAAIRDAPYERTLFLDCDTYVVRDVRCLFDVLERFDMAAAQDSNRVAVPLGEVPEAFPEFNTGVLAFRRSEPVQAFARRWLELYDKRAKPEHPSQDQPWFRLAAFESDLRVATLAPEYNLRFLMAGHYNLPAAILHSHATIDQFERFAAVAGKPLDAFWLQYVHIDGQIHGPLGSASKILDLRPWWFRHRSTRVAQRAFQWARIRAPDRAVP